MGSVGREGVVRGGEGRRKELEQQAPSLNRVQVNTGAGPSADSSPSLAVPHAGCKESFQYDVSIDCNIIVTRVIDGNIDIINNSNRHC